MLFKSTKEFNKLVKVFAYNGLRFYNFKNKGRFDLALPPSEDTERLVFSLKHSISVNGIMLEEKDMAYVPQDTNITLSTDEDSYVFISECPAMKKYPFYIKKYRDAERKRMGQKTYQRTVVVSIGENDPANKFIAGYVEDSIGEWSSYPPHKHDDKPEAYVFYNIDPGFAVQLVMDGDDEKAYVVHDYDTVLIPRGYHPHVNTSLNGSCYAWVMSAPFEERSLSVQIHPAFRKVALENSHLTIAQ